MAHTFNETEAARRINAYTDFLMAAYGTDADGLADLVKIEHGKMREYAAADYEDKDAETLQRLSRLTGISVSWLFAESGGDDPRKGASASGAGAEIDPDDFHGALTNVKGCAAALTMFYLQDAGRVTYDSEMFELLAGKLHEAARYLDGVMETL